MNKMLQSATVIVFFSLALSACGGGGSSTTPSTSGGSTGNSTGNSSGGSTGSSTGGSSGGSTGGSSGNQSQIVQPSFDSSIQQATLTRTAPTSNCQVTQLTGGYEDQGLQIEEAYWLQVVQQDVTDTENKLAANKKTHIRVDVTTAQSNIGMPSSAKLVLGESNGQCHTITLTTSETVAPQLPDRAYLSKSFVGVIPANLMTASLASYQIVANDDLASTTAAANRLYMEGTLNVAKSLTDQVVIKRLSFNGQTGYLPTETELTNLVKRTYPQSSLSFTYDPNYSHPELVIGKQVAIDNGVYIFSRDSFSKVIGDILNECTNKSSQEVLTTQERFVADAVRCVVPWPDNIAFQAPGGGVLGGEASISAMMVQSFDSPDDFTITSPYLAEHWISNRSQIFLHEFGHMMNLGHAQSCGAPPGYEDGLYSDGQIGEFGGGYDEVRDLYFNAQGGTFFDLMGYCTKSWASDRAYRKVVASKTVSGSAGASSASASRIDSRGQPSSSESDGIDGMAFMFHKKDGKWTVSKMYAPKGLVQSTYLPKASLISPLLGSLPVYTMRTHYGEMKYGPYLVQATPELLERFNSGTLMDFLRLSK